MSDIEALQKRAKDLEDWLRKNATEASTEQKHLDEGTQERIYWHYGHLVAIRDIYRLLTGLQITKARGNWQQDKDTSYPLA